MATLTCIPSTRAMNAMCKLLSDYKAKADNRATLAEIRQELGNADYIAFRDDMVRLMRKMPAAKAVAEIIGAAMRRKRELLAANRSQRNAQ
jgi:hypothetical protein